MRIGIITPAPPRSRYGNRVTALRWARILKKLGHRVRVTREYDGEFYDLLIALHALKNHEAVRQFHQQHPDSPIIVALTGTDLYRDLRSGGARRKPLARRARAEMKINKRYRWLGEQPRWRARRILSRSRIMVLSSRMEGGANVLSESLIASVPVLASRIAGNEGVLRE